MSRYSSGKSFKAHVPVYPFGTDPSKNSKFLGQPLPLRQTYSFSWIKKGNGAGQMGRMAGAIAPATAELTCTQANVEPGKHIIRIGPYELRPAVDFVVGGNDNALAANLAAAISSLSGFTAAAVLAVVTIETTTAHGDDTRLEVVEWSAVSAFALTTLNRPGYMDRGAPVPSVPLIA